MSPCSQLVAMASSLFRSPTHSADWSIIELTCPKSSLSCTLDLPFNSTQLVKKKKMAKSIKGNSTFEVVPGSGSV